MRFGPSKPEDVPRFRRIARLMREHGYSPSEAAEIDDRRQLAEWQAKTDAASIEIQETARTFERVAGRLPRHQRETFLDLPLGAAAAMAIRHFAPRQRGRCERRPRVRVVRRRSGRVTRAGPKDPDEPEPAKRWFPTNDLTPRFGVLPRKEGAG
jgi:hypothetical protein